MKFKYVLAFVTMFSMLSFGAVYAVGPTGSLTGSGSDSALEGSDGLIPTGAGSDSDSALEGSDGLIPTGAGSDSDSALEGGSGSIPTGSGSDLDLGSGLEGSYGPTTDEVIITPNNNGGGSSSGGSRSRAARANLASAEGEYSSDAGTCQILTTYMRRGMENNIFEVIVLQAFLNKEMNANLPLTGFFGPLTEQAVKDFQTKYASEILLPWFNAGLSASSEAPTGYVYKTTLHKINSILCAGIKLEAPVLN